MEALELGHALRREPFVSEQLVAQFAYRAQRVTVECQVYMVAHSLGAMDNAQNANFELQLFIQLARDRQGWVFVFVNPAAGQAPGLSWMIGVFDKEHAPVFIENDGRHADGIARLNAAENQVGQAHNKWKAAE